MFYYNQTSILLEKSENLLELSVKHLVIRLVSWISLGQAMIGVWKNQMLLFVAKLSISESNKSLPSLSLMIRIVNIFY